MSSVGIPSVLLQGDSDTKESNPEMTGRAGEQGGGEVS